MYPHVNMSKKNKVNKVCSSDFSILLVNMSNYPNINKLVAENVKADEGSYTLDDVAGVDSGYVSSPFVVFFQHGFTCLVDMC